MLADRMRMVNGKRLDAYTKLLLHFDETVGSKVFTDEAGIGNFTTQSGEDGAVIDTYSKFGGRCLYLNTAIISDVNYLPATEISENDFTVDFWVNMPTITATKGLFEFGNGNANFRGYIDSSYRVSAQSLDVDANTKPHNTGFALTVGTWYHLAFVRSGTMLYICVNGILRYSDTIIPNMRQANQGLFIGKSLSYKGQERIDEFRFSLGIARWTANFTPPTKEY
jgi:hypothetical protein